MKKKIILIAAIVICVAILASGTLSYFADNGQVHNVITTSSVDIAIEEWQRTADGLIPYPKDKTILIMPDTTVSKIVTIRNLKAEAYIRAKYEVVITRADGNVMELTPETLASMITLTMNSTEWIRKDGDDEWWYYANTVPSDSSTKALFTEIVFDGPNITNVYQNCTVEVLVKAQSVQTANNGGSVLDAAGWPAE